ncbi:MAG TPA: cytochrome P460 family protein [Steroidobacteraceae bacterium]
MNGKELSIAATVVALAVTSAASAGAPAAAPAGAAGPTLQRPPDVRELVFLSSGQGMAYGPAADKAKQGGGPPPFTNVFVTRQAYRSFMRTGTWPDGATFFLEVRAGVAHTSHGTHGSSQGELLALEAEQKDRTRYPGAGFAYFNFGPGGADQKARPLPATATCYACHRQHGAVQWTFTQFYPEQFAVAKKSGTVRKDYDPNL